MNKKLVTIVSLIVISSFLFGTIVSAKSENNPFNQIWSAIFDLQSQVDEIEASSGAIRYVYEGTIDLNSDGDVIKTETDDPFSLTSDLHYKAINVPELELNDMPQVDVYVKIYNQNGTIDEMWRKAESIMIGTDRAIAVYDEQTVLINYKMNSSLGNTGYWINGEYKIVVIK